MIPYQNRASMCSFMASPTADVTKGSFTVMLRVCGAVQQLHTIPHETVNPSITLSGPVLQ